MVASPGLDVHREGSLYTDATWSKWVALIIQQAQMGNPICLGILEVIMDWPEGKDFGVSPEEEVTRAEEAPLYNKLPENEKQYALFTDVSCRIVGKQRRWKTAVWILQDKSRKWPREKVSSASFQR